MTCTNYKKLNLSFLLVSLLSLPEPLPPFAISNLYIYTIYVCH